MSKGRKARKGAAKRAGSSALVHAVRAKVKTAEDLIAEKLEDKYQLTDEQLAQVKKVLEHNDSCDSHNKKVRIEKMWKLLHDHYGFKAGVRMLNKLVCESLGRTSWGNP